MKDTKIPSYIIMICPKCGKVDYDKDHNCETEIIKQENLDKMKAFIRKFEDQLIEIIKTIGGVDSVLFDTKNPILQIFSLRTKYEKRCKE